MIWEENGWSGNAVMMSESKDIARSARSACGEGGATFLAAR